ncbi:ethyl tert-butyl ether degradation protein EthD [Paraburkholderia sp.]|uniref:ethyl tert-butyl ether degradation protein EthD n=1 Tax=Paraburkholderia sp. TaxID=1926495 RepID=UPI002637D6C2|nr:ethyl tert-butyl ether degradation protein EthD [Paraburkholderia sp.]
MDVCLFLIGTVGDMPDVAPTIDAASLHAATHAMDGLRRLVIHRPVEPARGDPLLSAPEKHPHSVLQWYFDDLGALEMALERDGRIQAALDISGASSHQSLFAQQVMAVRTFATPAGAGVPQQPAERCTYLVSYEGEAVDFNAWLTHYLIHHPPLMAELPGIRELEIYTRVDYRSGLALPRATAMQRNKVVFDDPLALSAALASPVRARMKLDFDRFPPYSGSTPHYPMRSIYGNLREEPSYRRS